LTGNFFISHTIQTLLQYRQRIEQLNELFLEEFKQKLQLHATKVEAKELKQEIVSFNNAGKNIDIDLSTIVYIVSDNIYQEFVCHENGKITKILVRNTLSTIEKQLEKYPEFLRCHRSYIVNTRNIVSIDGNSRQQSFLLDMVDEKIPISRSLTSEILYQFDALINS
jgi:DNA-binding LytR/AlgR family response regulator